MAATAPSTDQLLSDQPTGSLVVPRLRTGTSIAQLAYEAIRAAVLAMDVHHPEADLRLDEKELAADLGVSRTPVRNALARLEHEGLVRIVPRRGGTSCARTSGDHRDDHRVGGAGEHGRPPHVRASDRRGDRQLRTLFATFEDGELRLRLDEYSAANLRFTSASSSPAARRCSWTWPMACSCTCARSEPGRSATRPRRAVDRRPHAHHRGAGGSQRRAVRALVRDTRSTSRNTCKHDPHLED